MEGNTSCMKDTQIEVEFQR